MQSPSEFSAYDLSGAIATQIHALISGDFQSRWETAKQLTDLGEAAIPALIDLLADDTVEWEVHWFAARILSAYDRPEVVAALLELFQTAEDDDLRQSATEALSQIGASAVVALTSLLNTPHRPFAVSALASIRHPSTLTVLLGLTAEPEADLRATVLETLSSFRDERVGQALRAALSDPAPQVRQAALKGLTRQRDHQETAVLVEQIVPLLGDINPAVCQQTIHALGRLDHETAITALAHLIGQLTTPEFLQIEAVQTLGWMQSAVALEALLELWPQVTWPVRQAIVTALSYRQNPDERQSIAVSLMDWLKAVPLVPETVPVRQSLALTLGQLNPPDIGPILAAMTQDPDERVRLHALAAQRQLAVSSDPVQQVGF